MGFIAKFKEAFAPRTQFLGDDGSLIVLHDDYIERIWGRVCPQNQETVTLTGAQRVESSSQRSQMWGLENMEASLSPDGSRIHIASEQFEWEIPVPRRQSNEAALFVNKVNNNASGATLSLATFVHSRQ